MLKLTNSREIPLAKVVMATADKRDSANTEIYYFELRLLLEQFKKSLELSFATDLGDRQSCFSDNDLLEPVFTACNSVLLHHMKISNETNLNTPLKRYANHEKLLEDFEFISKSACFRNSVSNEPMSFDALVLQMSIEQYFHCWILRNYKSGCLCVAIEELVADKALLDHYYAKNAFLKNAQYATAFCIGIKALESNQSSLLSQIDCGLYTSHRHRAKISENPPANHKRQSSHPNFSLNLVSTHREKPDTGYSDMVDGSSRTMKKRPSSVRQHSAETKTFPLFRKVKSLPIMLHLTDNSSLESTITTSIRKRCKTLGASCKAIDLPPRSQPKSANMDSSTSESPRMLLNEAEGGPIGKADINELPSTSASSCSSSRSHNSQDSSSSASVCDKNRVVARQIQIINCDDIKIWTENDALTISPSLETQSAQKSKSMSPRNGFLSSLFGTPPTYSSWYKNAQDADGEDGHGHYPDNTKSYYENSSCGMGFLPVYGKKLETRQKQGLFEDGISTLDCSASTSTPLKSHQVLESSKALLDAHNRECAEETTILNSKDKGFLKSNPSLTTFLQASQVSRNDTDLEKENAHFRISEAIITAIEHLKCRRQQSNLSAAPATDWLANDREQKSQAEESAQDTISFEASGDESVPYVDGRDVCHEELSAEVVGLSLISKFNEKHLPTIAELKWLVSEEDAPQQLLPIPDVSGTSNPDENTIPSMTRGTKYWAPPRQQIIFTDHPTPNRKDLVARQNYRCSGCGMRVHSQYIGSFRYCSYFGKYHCTGCHRNQMSVIPAKILQTWDFKCYPVSVFAYRLLEQMYTFPLFNVPDLNPALYVKSKALLQARNKRLQLKFVKDFVLSCRFAVREQKYFNSIPEYITNDIETWSMSDFVDAHNESMQRSIDDLILTCENHINHCVLCNGRGFICEHCKRDQVLFPWYNKKVFRCDRCGSCFHLSCWKAMSEVCCRCQRIHKRQDATQGDVEGSFPQKFTESRNGNGQSRRNSINSSESTNENK